MKEKDTFWFGEWVYMENAPEGKEEATLYLKLWKKFLLRKLREELHDYMPYGGQMVDMEAVKANPDTWYELWIERPPWEQAPLVLEATLGLKFCMKRKLPEQIN